ncbi:MAG: multidrug efflux SMR transporter [Candidatus Korobacteraceae bacterium]
MSWLFLGLAIFLDVLGTVFLKLSQGCSRPLLTGAMLVCYASSLPPMALALRQIEVSVAYSVWSALGTALAVGIGIVWFKEPATAMRIASLALIIAGLFFLNLSAQTI